MNGTPIDNRPLVAIAVPCGDRVHSEFAECLWGQGRGAKHHRQGLIFGHSSMIVNARNQCVDAARQINAEYLMFIDSDMTWPYKTIDVLLAHKKDIVGCTYRRRGPPFNNLGHTLHEKDKKNPSGLIEMSHMPTGMLLIKMSVFERFAAPYFRFTISEETGTTNGEDFVFSVMAREAGFRLWCDVDLSKEIAHMYQYPLKVDDDFVQEVQNKYETLERGSAA